MLGMILTLAVHGFCFTAPLLPELHLKAPYCVPWETLWLVTGSYGSAAGEGTGRGTSLYPPDCFLLCSASTVASQHTAGGYSGSVSEHVKMQLYDFISHTALSTGHE